MRRASTSRHIDMATVAMGVPAGVISNDTGFFFTGRWKHARIAAIVDVVAEVVLLGMSISVGWHFATVWTICALIGASITAGACCCRANSGKCIANAQVSLTAISFIGSFVDIVILAHVTDLCNTYDYTGWASKSFCDVIKALLALEVICLATRLTVITLASRRTCCRPAEWNVVQAPAQPQDTRISGYKSTGLQCYQPTNQPSNHVPSLAGNHPTKPPSHNVTKPRCN